MDHTTIKGGIIFLGKKEFTNLITSLIKGYEYHYGSKPTGLVIPYIYKVDGIEIQYEGGKDAEDKSKVGG